MPYITKGRRFKFSYNGIEFPNHCGELNYTITKIVHRYISEHSLCYKTLNEIIGVLECCKLELYRQIVSPYEDIKKQENGNVSELDR